MMSTASAASGVESLEHALRKSERVLASERKQVEALDEAILEKKRELNRREARCEQLRKDARALECKVVVERERANAMEREIKAEQARMSEYAREMERMERERRRARDEETAAMRERIAMETSMRTYMMLSMQSAEKQELIAEKTKEFENGPWVDEELRDVPEELLELCRRIVELRKSNAEKEAKILEPTDEDMREGDDDELHDIVNAGNVEDEI